MPACMQLAADTTGINSSHHIHRVAFGPTFPGQVNPLDGMQPAGPCADTVSWCIRATMELT